MINKELITQNITQSSLAPQLQRIAMSVLPQLGEYSLEFLSLEMNRSKSNQALPSVLHAFVRIARLLDQARTGDIASVAPFLNESVAMSEFDFGRYAVPFVADLKQILTTKKINISKEFQLAMDEFELKLFAHLPQEIIVEILERKVLYFAQKIDLVMDFKKIYITEQLGDDGTWNQPYLRALYNNEELLGTEPFVLDNKTVSPMIRNWISDFIVSEPSVKNEAGVYPGAHYISHSKQVAALSEQQKNAILAILKLYVWLLNPEADIEEIEEYEQQQYPASTELDFKFVSQRFNDTRQQSAAVPNLAVPRTQQFRPPAGARAAPVAQRPVAQAPRPAVPSTLQGVRKPLPATVNMQDILNRQGQKSGGLVYDQPTNVRVDEMTQRIEADRQEKQKIIDKKLEELKKRGK